ncbi:hypothetical protein A3K29_05950 [Candidatus Collierbacteria bacterium RIFOXYB2_FULL_46_14]|nr:MAG: hypothetical protein A3K29_05950 [Candidatus Collierbacteria bacterium RIFOXYB2_FULL_46_14]OGD76674.1 MAG: hypothetical protein A3K43_05950 [Candidatus Collierbacteria bacterium RIFOXYA2_FULL_46_20]OGD78010.1 MAG: hypothetical protein A3K39_05950 [Candidatus Collierbacteria bacterium RIFOXYC2_FULL_43_15]OGD80034.1 MAG: hypothetical protein A2320_00380 [Pseudomonadales bacterium GWC2_63_15]OGD82732.1 MAG: hypothetical protein A3K36_05950 [Candidatus Collierbacteria bacterium RIFOXYD2_FUL
MKHDPIVTGHAAGATTAIVYTVCRLLVGLFPDWMYSMGQSWFHGIALQKLENTNLTLGSFFSGFISVTISAWLVGFLFASMYNSFLTKK